MCPAAGQGCQPVCTKSGRCLAHTESTSPTEFLSGTTATSCAVSTVVDTAPTKKRLPAKKSVVHRSKVASLRVLAYGVLTGQ